MNEKQPELPITPEEEQAWRELMTRAQVVIEYSRSVREREERDRARQPEVND